MVKPIYFILSKQIQIIKNKIGASIKKGLKPLLYELNKRLSFFREVLPVGSCANYRV